MISKFSSKIQNPFGNFFKSILLGFVLLVIAFTTIGFSTNFKNLLAASYTITINNGSTSTTKSVSSTGISEIPNYVSKDANWMNFTHYSGGEGYLTQNYHIDNHVTASVPYNFDGQVYY